MAEGRSEGAQEPSSESSRPGAQAQAFNVAVAMAGIAIVVFIIGVVVGFPVATFGVEFLTQNAGVVFGLLFGFFVLVLLIAGFVLIFRQQIWQSLFKRGEVEMERFARPLSEVARFAALQKVAEATESARDLAELVLARYAWVSTRRWLMATITAFIAAIAAIAALAGAALLFQQNQLLRTQIGLMQDQNARIDEQNRFIQSQIELGEAQRSTAIVPEILELGGQIGAELEKIRASGVAAPQIGDLSPSLRARIVAATLAARPYRYLRTPLLDLDEQMMMSSGLLRRTDLTAADTVRQRLVASGATAEFNGEQQGVLSDRPLSPERGQIVSILLNSGLGDLSQFSGADFSFAEVRTGGSASLIFDNANLRFADFDRELVNGRFDGAYLEHARFRNARVNQASFSTRQMSTLLPGQAPLTRRAELSGTDFSGALLSAVRFDGSRGFGINFDGAVVHNVSFLNAEIAGGTFRNTIFGVVDFTGAGLKSVDFDGAIVFDPAFLDTVAAQAAADTFVRDRFTLEPIPPEQFAQHPRWSDAWLDGLEEKQAYRIVRVGNFE